MEQQLHNIPKMLFDLENLLKKQIEHVRQDNIREVEALAERTDHLVEEMSGYGVFKSPEFEQRRGEFEQLYCKLRLAVSSGKARTGEQLKRLRKAKKTVVTYRKNI